jgi:hypothetical protein
MGGRPSDVVRGHLHGFGAHCLTHVCLPPPSRQHQTTHMRNTSLAIWNRNHLVGAFCLLGTLVLLALFIYGIVETQEFWDNQSDRTCIVPGGAAVTTLLPMLTSTLVVDISLLLLMLWGLLRLRDARRWGVGRFLWAQGVVWLMIAAAAEVPTVVSVAPEASLI